MLTVNAKVAGDITETEIIMNKGLTQGGTSSPARFKLFINDLPETLRAALKEQGMDAEELDPTRLVADDVVCLGKSVEAIQILLNACYKWALEHKQSWNPSKSQVLILRPDITPNPEPVHLGGVFLEWVTMVVYLGLRLDKDGFKGKYPEEVEAKARAAMHMLTQQPWFTLELEPKYVTQDYMSHVRSTLLYGAELLTHDARKPFIEIDDKITSLFLSKLLKLGSRPLPKKHLGRLQIGLGLPPLSMDIDKLVAGRIATWIYRRTDPREHVAEKANASIQDVMKLDPDHSLREALDKYRPISQKAKRGNEVEGWEKLAQDSMGTGPDAGTRQLKASKATTDGNRPSFIETKDLNGNLRKAALRWSVYRFPVKYEPTNEEHALLMELPRWQIIDESRKEEAAANPLKVYNDEEQKWKRPPLENTNRPDIRSISRTDR